MSLSQVVQRTPWLMAGLSLPLQLYRKHRIYQERMFFETMDRLSVAIDQDVSVSLPEYGGSFFLSPQSHLFRRIGRTGTYEPEVLDHFVQHIRPDADVVDVGANIGFFTVGAASRLTSGRVLAIEPTSGAYKRLCSNIERNGFKERVIAFRGVASSAPGEIEIKTVPGREEYSSVGDLAHPAIRGRAEAVLEIVPAETIDNLVSKHALHPSVIKIDVEGAETMVFRGAERTMREHKPVIISEICEEMLVELGSSRRELVDLIESRGYEVRSMSDHRANGAKRDGEIICFPRSG
ncbi:FkbM family methyltransferase [Caulobacter sp. 1776]|uniref:FkbM family methyltransferase n=1 Tax=Caulobacter sp. 1776 TaxID=3156420 RepID=UPI00339898A9